MAKLEPITESVQLKSIWRESLGKSGAYSFMPALTYNGIFAAANNGEISRIEGGKSVWRVNTGQKISGGVGSDGKLVVVGTAKGDVLAFDENGGERWKAKASTEVLAPPAVGNGVVIVRSGDNRLTAFDAANGQQKWVFSRPTPALSLRVTTPPVLDERFVITGFPGGKLIVLNLENGSTIWEGTVATPKGSTEIERVADIVSMPVTAGDVLCAVAYQGRVTCFDTKNGTAMWNREISSYSGLATDGRALYVADEKGAIHAFDLTSGSSLWKQDKLFLRKLSAPAVLKNRVIVGDVEGVLHVLDRTSGAFIGRASTDGSAITAPLQIKDDQLIVQTVNGGVFGFAME